MTVHDLGYRDWHGRLARSGTLWCVIAETGIRRGWQSSWLRRMLLVAWFPALWLAAGFFFFEQSMQYPDARGDLAVFLRAMPQASVLAESLQVDPREATSEELEASRHSVWAWFLQTFFVYPQAVLMVLVVGLVAPPLISHDVRSRAFLLYFSRPITRTEYVLGKAASMWFYLGMITLVPALALYVLGVLLSPSLDVVAHTWDLPLRTVAASLVLMVPTTALALMLSSLSQESRYAAFAWFAVWILGWVSYGVVRGIERFNTLEGRRYGERQDLEMLRQPGNWRLLSPYHTLGEVQSWIFGFRREFGEVWPAAVLLVVMTLVSLMFLFRRVSAPMRA